MKIRAKKDLRDSQGYLCFIKDREYEVINDHTELNEETRVTNENGLWHILAEWYTNFEVVEEPKIKTKSYTDLLNEVKLTLSLLNGQKTALEEAISELNKIHQQQEEKPLYKRFKPEYDDRYWYIDSVKGVNSDFWDDHAADIYRFNTFNCFKTKEEAEKERDIGQVWYELREFAKERNSKRRKEPGYMGSICCKIHGIPFIDSLDVEEMEKHFGDRLKLLDEM